MSKIITFHGRCLSQLDKGKYYGELGIVRAIEDGVISQVMFDTYPGLKHIWVTFDRHDFEPTEEAIRYTSPDGEIRTSAFSNEDYSELLLIAQEKMDHGKWIKREI